MELLLYLAEFQDEEGEVEDPLEVDRLMQSEADAPDPEKPPSADHNSKPKPDSRPESNPQRTNEPAHDAT
jgi:hypothetical protein